MEGGSTLSLTYSQGDLFLQGEMIFPASMSPNNTWKSLFVTLRPGVNASVEVVSGTDLLQHTIDLELSNTSITSVSVGVQYTGLIQDFLIYIPALSEVGGRVEIPKEAKFLPLCLCPSGYEFSLSEDECILEGNQISRCV